MVVKHQLHEDRYFSSDSIQRSIAKDLYQLIKDLPLICPHGHIDPILISENSPFPDPTELLVIPDHYLFRMLYSQGIGMDSLGIPCVDGNPFETDHRKIWQIVGDNFYLFRGTPTGLWLKHELYDVLGIREKLNSENAMKIYDQIVEVLSKPENLPRAMYERFNIEVLSTTNYPHETLDQHKDIKKSGWKGRLIPAFRPDNVTDFYHAEWRSNINLLSQISELDCAVYKNYIHALEKRRVYFKEMGCVSTDHGITTPFTINLSSAEAEKLFNKGIQGTATPNEAKMFTGHMMLEMARMSLEDGLTMQIHAGVFRNYNPQVYRIFGADKGCDIPIAVDFVHDLKPLLDRFGNEINLTIILFTIDESVYARELAPLAGHFPALKLGPAWWFNDSREGMLRFRRMTTETAGIYNTVGFNDDTRAFPSIPARHDLARRIDCRYLAELVAEHIIDIDEANEMVVDLAYNLPKKNYHL